MTTELDDVLALARKKRQEIAAKTGRGMDVKKPRDGKNRIRILPSWRSGVGKAFWQDFGQHWIKDRDNTVKAVVGCFDVTYGEPCAICDMLSKAGNLLTDDGGVKMLADAKAKGRVLVNALLLDGDKSAALTPVIYELTPTTFDSILSLMEEYGNITDLNEGVDIIIERTGSGLTTEYKVMPAPKSVKVPSSVLEKLINIDEAVKPEFIGKENKAVAALSHLTGVRPALTASSAARLTGPAISAEASDEISLDDADDKSVSSVTSTPDVTKAPPAASTAAASSTVPDDDEIAKMLADLDL